MKILYISTISSWSDSHTARYLSTLAAAGHQCQAIAVEGHEPVAGFIGLPPTTHHFWKNSSLANIAHALRQRCANSVRVLKAASRIEYDLVLCSEPDSMAIAIVLKMLKGSRIVLHIREVYEDRASAFPALARPMLRSLFRRLLQCGSLFCDHVIHVSKEREDLYGYLRCPSSVVGLYPHASDPNYDQAQPPRSGRELVLLHLGALRATYAADSLIEAIVKLRDAGAPVRLIAVGGTAGPIGKQRELDEMVRAGVIELTAAVPHEYVHHYLNNADVGLSLVLPVDDTHRYAQPRKLFEYMRAGLPAIGSDVPTIRSVVESARCGIVVDSQSPDALIAAVLELAASKERRRLLGQNGLAACRSRYNWDLEEPKLKAVFQALSPPRASARAEVTYP